MSLRARVRDWFARRFPEKSLGDRGEDAAAKFLKRQGYHILARSLDSPLGELDIIAVDGRTVVFVEVKTRRSEDAGRPSEAIDPRTIEPASAPPGVELRHEPACPVLARRLGAVFEACV